MWRFHKLPKKETKFLFLNFRPLPFSSILKLFSLGVPFVIESYENASDNAQHKIQYSIFNIQKVDINVDFLGSRDSFVLFLICKIV